MSKPSKTTARNYGELLVRCHYGQWIERFYLRSDYPGGLQAAWQACRRHRATLLGQNVAIVGERGPCDAGWFPEGPNYDTDKIKSRI